MLALCLMLSSTYYAKNYAGIIGLGLMIHIVDNDNVATYGNCVNYDHYDNGSNYSGQ